MRVIFYELKKIFNLKSTLVGLVIFILFIMLWDMWSIDRLPYQGEWEYDIVKLYGTQLSPEEAEKAKTEYVAQLENEATKLISENELMQKNGIDNYEEYYVNYLNGPFYLRGQGIFSPEFYPELTEEEFEAEYGLTYEEAMQPLTTEEKELFEKYVDETSPTYEGREINSLIRKMMSFKGQIEELYGDKERVRDVFITGNKDEAEKARVARIFDTDEYYNVSYDNANYKVRNIVTEVPVVVFLLIVILLAPAVTRDNMTGVAYLQYSAKYGRKILVKQLLAMLFACAIIIAVVFGLSAGKLIAETPKELFSIGLNGFNTIHEQYWLNTTVGGFAALNYALVAVAAFGLTFALFCASFTSRNYIQMIIKVIPVAAVYLGFFFIFGDGFFCLDHYYFNVYDILKIPFAEIYVCAVMLVAPIIPSVVLICRNKGRDML